MEIIKVPLIYSSRVTAECELRHLLLTTMIIHSDIYIRILNRKKRFWWKYCFLFFFRKMVIIVWNWCGVTCPTSRSLHLQYMSFWKSAGHLISKTKRAKIWWKVSNNPTGFIFGSCAVIPCWPLERMQVLQARSSNYSSSSLWHKVCTGIKLILKIKWFTSYFGQFLWAGWWSQPVRI